MGQTAMSGFFTQELVSNFKAIQAETQIGVVHVVFKFNQSSGLANCNKDYRILAGDRDWIIGDHGVAAVIVDFKVGD